MLAGFEEQDRHGPVKVGHQVEQDGRLRAKGGHDGDAPLEAVEGPAKRTLALVNADPWAGTRDV